MSDGIHWTVALERHAAFREYAKLVEERLEHRRRLLEGLQPGASSDAFQRIAGQIEALRWVLALPTSQKPKPGDRSDP